MTKKISMEVRFSLPEEQKSKLKEIKKKYNLPYNKIIQILVIKQLKQDQDLI